MDEWGRLGLELVDPTRPPVLARGDVDRMAAHRGDVAWLDEAWSRGQLLTLGRRGLVETVGTGLLLSPTQGERPATAWLLGTHGRAHPGADPGADSGADPGADSGADGDFDAGGDTAYFVEVVGELDGRDLRELGASLSDRDSALLTTAVALANWHAVTTHCPRCGTATEVESAGWVRRCPRDGSQHFPRSDPAVIMLITSPDGADVVLGRQASWPPGRYSCLAGFVEPGESAEQAVVRETAEESGLRVRDVRGVGSQPWPFPASLMLGFRAVADRLDLPVSVDGELQHVAWFSRAQILAGEVILPPTVSIANRIIAEWLAERAARAPGSGVGGHPGADDVGDGGR